MELQDKWEILSRGMEEYASILNIDDAELKCLDASDKPKPGGSNAGKYKTKGPFCGPAGGAPKGTYPVNTRKRAVAALAYARHAPRPAGIKRCVCRNWPSLPACKKDSADSVASTIDELRTMYNEGMLSRDAIFIEIMDLSKEFNLKKGEIASLVIEVFSNDNPSGAIEALDRIVRRTT